MIALTTQFSFAQTKTISGTVSDDSGPLPGATVMIKGSSAGTLTDFDGLYNINAKEGDILQFSYVGMETVEKTVGTSSIINTTLKGNIESLDEVVITALGISKKERGLGVSVGEVDNESLTRARSTSPIEALSGKVSGLKITQQSGTPGGSSSVIIRGATSLSGSNQPIFVIDGMPISNQSFNQDDITGGVDGGNRAGDLNPDDIESVSVLKGASASALYGARAKNGAIIITTKKGNKNSGLKIDVNSSLRFDSPLKLPEYQNEYAQGTSGTYDKDAVNGWGPKISDVANQTFTDFKGDDVTLSAKPNNVKDFFNTGITKINSVAFSGGDTKSDYRFSYTNSNVEGIVPNSNYKKNNYTLNVGRNFTDKFTLRTNINYINSTSSGRTQQGSNDGNVVIDNILGMSRTISFDDLKNNYINAAGDQIPLTQRSNNPYWVLNQNPFSIRLERFIGSATLDYKITKNLKLVNKLGTDFFNESRQKLYAVGSLGTLKGSFTNWDYYNQIINNDFYLSYTKDSKDGISISAILGHNLYQTKYERTTLTGNNLTVPGLYVLGNAETLNGTDFSSKKELYGVYTDINLDYKNTFFLNLTGRNDWSSTLPADNNSYFYPSVNGAIVFSEFIEDKSILSFGKIRAGYAEVGSDAEPYSLLFGFVPSNDYYVQFSLSNNLPQGGIIGFEAPRVLPNAELKPQRKKEFELGFDLKLFKNIANIGFTYYNSNTSDQLLDISVPESTGFFSKTLNAGVVNNKGIELDVNLSPLINTNSKFQWDLGIVFNKNQQKVTSLIDGLDEFQLKSGWSGLTIKAAPGEEFGLYGTKFKTNDNGEYIINTDTGLKEVVTNQRLGDTAPDWTMGINNSFTYKNFGLGFLIDIKHGGTLFSGTTANLRSSGLAKETLAHRGETYIDAGVNEVTNTDGSVSYVENTTAVTNMEEYWTNQSGTSNTEGNIFDASYVKLREINFFYNVPSKLLKKTGITRLRLGVEARNLWIIDDNVPHIDPEVNFFGTGGPGATVEFASVPSVKSLGFNINLTF
ncbi:SusC/RagA family TonB-linked outer membrane protein [Wenyingzhuangia sp. chi5]|uniref:SusC/RagA family TonB-linked outer membrane protein n=1 Tax=Wenyingzhuangia gilva TaxID=3057677 RepID=A0ABT8VS53_9FLAO|nr:SusC/RagA family TonB-linked outer membrane protein [Wenyingzhuangia sp. chi5]MDO3694803.1 SusC/RagA family TonB-linked outer membrane protein [Wenyingzhuangia sp. chi5]